MEETYVVSNQLINNFKGSLRECKDSFGYILGQRCATIETNSERQVKVLGLVKLPLDIDSILKLEESHVNEDSSILDEFTQVVIAGIPTGVEVIGVFIAGQKHFSDWEQNDRLDFLTFVLTSHAEFEDVIDTEYLVWSLKGDELKFDFFFKEELYSASEERMKILESEVDTSKQKNLFRLRCSFPMSLEADSPISSFQEEIDRIIFDFNSNNRYAYFLEASKLLLKRSEVLDDTEFEGRNVLTDHVTYKGDREVSKEHLDITDVSLVNLVGESYATESQVEVPSLGYEKISQERLLTSLQVDCIVNPKGDVASYELVALLNQALTRQLRAQKYMCQYFSSEYGLTLLAPYHFQHEHHEFLITCLYPVESEKNGIINDSQLEGYRRTLHNAYLISETKPCLKPCLAYFSEVSHDRLINPHENLSKSGLASGIVSIVKGKYSYYHYMQDKVNDDGWGCAYRSLQTLCSWFIHQGYNSCKIPSHKEIQEALVTMGDKEKKFIGSKQWIGSFEVSMCIEHFLGVKSKILHVSSGADLGMKGRELVQHFNKQGTPVMIGGGVLAHTILGVYFDEATGETRFLILDPHYTGVDELNPILNKGWCGWKGVNFWDQTAHYNLCLPQRPLVI